MTALQYKEQILNEDRALRRIEFLNPDFIKEDGVPASSAFSLKRVENGEWESGISVDIERLTTYEKSIQDIRRFRLFALQVSFVRSIGFECEHDPIPGNYAHALIKGNFTRSLQRKLARNSVRIIYPD